MQISQLYTPPVRHPSRQHEETLQQILDELDTVDATLQEALRSPSPPRPDFCPIRASQFMIGSGISMRRVFEDLRRNA